MKRFALLVAMLSSIARANTTNPVTVENTPLPVTCTNCSGGGSSSSTFTVVNTTFQVVGLGGGPVAVSLASTSVSGSTVTAYQGGAPWAVTFASAATTNVSGSSVTAFQGGAPWSVTGSTVIAYVANQQSVSGSSVTAFQGGAPWAVTLPSTSVSGSTVTVYVANQQSVSGSSVTAYQGGAPWSVTLASTSVSGSTVTVYGSVSVSGTANVTGSTVTAYIGGQPLSVAQAGSYTVTPGTGTFPVSGTISATQGTTPWIVTNPSGQAIAVISTGTQTISGTVSVSNFPSVQAVSVTVDSFSATNAAYVRTLSTFPVTGAFFQATQPVSTVSTFPVSGAFFQAIQPVSLATTSVSGSTVTSYVSNFPAVQSVSTVSTFPVSGTFFQAVQPVSQSGSWTVTPGTGTWGVSGAVTVNGSTVAITNVSGSTITVVLTNSSVAVSNFPAVQPVSQSGSFTVTPGTGNWSVNGSTLSVTNVSGANLNVNVAAGTVAATQSGSWNVGQVGSYTVTPGTGIWSTSGSTVTAFQGGAWNVGQVGSYTVTPGTGNWNGSILGSVTVTPGTGTWSATQSGAWNVGQVGSYTVTPGSGTFVAGGVYNSSFSSLANGATSSLQVSVDGDLLVAINDPLPSGTNNIGTVSGSSVVAYQGDSWTTTPNFDTISATGSITALNSTFTVTGLHGVGSAIVNVTGVWVGTITIQASVDGVTWSTNSTSVPGQTSFSMVGISTNGSYRIPVVGAFQQQRAIFTGYTSGSATVQFYYSSVVVAPFVFQTIASNLNAQVVGNIASSTTDSGNPVKIASVYNSTMPVFSNLQRADLQSNFRGELAVVSRNKYFHLAGAATRTIKSGSGSLHAAILDAVSGLGGFTLYDNTAGSGSVIAINASGQAGSSIFDVEFSTGLTIVTTGASTDVTISYQ